MNKAEYKKCIGNIWRLMAATGVTQASIANGLPELGGQANVSALLNLRTVWISDHRARQLALVWRFLRKLKGASRRRKAPAAQPGKPDDSPGDSEILIPLTLTKRDADSRGCRFSLRNRLGRDCGVEISIERKDRAFVVRMTGGSRVLATIPVLSRGGRPMGEGVLADYIEARLNQHDSQQSLDPKAIRDLLGEDLGHWSVVRRRDGSMQVLERVSFDPKDLDLPRAEAIAEAAAAEWCSASEMADKIRKLEPIVAYILTYSMSASTIRRLGLPESSTFVILDDLNAAQSLRDLGDLKEAGVHVRAASKMPGGGEPGICQHSKVYLLADKGGTWHLFVGSGNLTGGAFPDPGDGSSESWANLEFFLYVSGGPGSTPIAHAIAHFRGLWETASKRNHGDMQMEAPFVYATLVRPQPSSTQDLRSRLPEYKLDETDPRWVLQDQVVRRAARDLDEHGASLIVMPPGTGKTIAAARVYAIVGGAQERNCIWVCPTEVVAYQTLGTLEALKNHGHWKGGISFYRGAEIFDLGGDDIVGLKDLAQPFALVSNVDQFNSAHGLKLLAEFKKLKNAVFLVVDEAHHAGTGEYEAVLKGLHARARGRAEGFDRSVLALGMTATPWRMQGGESWRFNRIGGAPALAALADALDKAALAQPEFSLIEHGGKPVRIQRYGTEGGDPVIGFDLLVTHRERNEAIVASIVKLVKDGKKKILVYAANQKHCEVLHRLLKEKAGSLPGFQLDRVHSGAETPRARQQTIQAFRDAPTAILINVQMLIEGYDVGGIDAVVLGRPTWSHAYYYQMVGRGMRCKENGTRASVVEFATSFVLADGSEAGRVVSVHKGEGRIWSPPVFNSWDPTVAEKLLRAVNLQELAR